MNRDPDQQKLTIAIAGASGFVGHALCEALAGQAHLIGLSRSNSKETGVSDFEWRKCDLYSRLELERALKGADVGVYLVHSMLPSAALVQANFQDLDLILADNFARSAKKCGLKHIVYLGGILPSDCDQGDWSDHLKSRYEVEEVLKASGIPASVLRAAVITGPGGSSLEIMKRLIERLPVMVCPAWCSSQSSPVSLTRVVEALKYLSLRADLEGRVYDLAESKPITYLEMMKSSARVLGVSRLFVSVPFFSPKLSRLWVSTVTGAPKNLVYPLIMSLEHNLLPRPDHQLLDFSMDRDFSELFRAATSANDRPHAFRTPKSERQRAVRSVQRLTTKTEYKASEVGVEYMKFLGLFFSPILKVKIKGGAIGFYFPLIPRALLILSYSHRRSDQRRVLFYTRGGLLSRREGKGRLEFRVLEGMGIILAAIHDFRPRLPWTLYRATQAIVHVWVMRSFGRYLSR